MILCHISQLIIQPERPFALRLSSILMVGVLRIYQQQMNYAYSQSPIRILFLPPP